MSDAEAVSVPVVAPVPFTAKSLLAHVNERIVEAKRMIRHRHDDAAYWDAIAWQPGWAQAARSYLRYAADLLHVERATQRGRIHGSRFATLDEQREWLRSMENRSCGNVACYAGLPGSASLAKLRAGELFEEVS